MQVSEIIALMLIAGLCTLPVAIVSLVMWRAHRATTGILRDAMKANLALSEKPAASTLANAMEMTDNKAVTNGQPQVVGIPMRRMQQ